MRCSCSRSGKFARAAAGGCTRWSYDQPLPPAGRDARAKPGRGHALVPDDVYGKVQPAPSAGRSFIPGPLQGGGGGPGGEGLSRDAERLYPPEPGASRGEAKGGRSHNLGKATDGIEARSWRGGRGQLHNFALVLAVGAVIEDRDGSEGAG